MDLNEKLMGMEQATGIPGFFRILRRRKRKRASHLPMRMRDLFSMGITARLLTLHICRYRCIHRKVLIICRRNMPSEIIWREQDSV